MSLQERLKKGETLICAEGYLFELERRGYVKAGAFVPTCVLEHPQALRSLHRDFLHCGSDVLEAFTYYAHREKLRLVGFEDRIEELNRAALRIAKEVAAEKPGTLVAGNVSNTNIWVPDVPETHASAREMFAEQIKWAKDEGVDFIIGETFNHTGEALCALEEIKKAGMASVITVVVHKGGMMLDGETPVECLVKLKKAGADVVGYNCGRGPATMIPLLRDVAKCEELKGFPIAALPVAYTTDECCPTFQGLCDPTKLYTDADKHVCTRYEFADFAAEANKLGCKYLGTCCGGAPHHIRAMAERLAKPHEASKYAPDISQHCCFGKAGHSQRVLDEKVQKEKGDFEKLEEKVKAYYAKMHALM